MARRASWVNQLKLVLLDLFPRRRDCRDHVPQTFHHFIIGTVHTSLSLNLLSTTRDDVKLKTGNWLAQLASKKTQHKRPAKCPTDLIKVQKTIGQLVLKTLNVLTDPNNTQDVGKVIEAFAKTLAIEDNQRLLNGEKCGLPGWRVIKLGSGQQSLNFYHPSGLRFKNSWKEVLNFMDRCEQTLLPLQLLMSLDFLMTGGLSKGMLLSSMASSSGNISVPKVLSILR